MSMIRFSTEEVFSTDSQQYEVLVNAIDKIKGIPGAVIEIGTRRGGSAKMMIDKLVENQDTNRSFFCLDPYGNIEIECTNHNISIHYPQWKVEGDPNSKEITSPRTFDYDNTMRNRVIPSLYYYAYSAGLNFNFFCLEDTEFFKRYSDGVPVYNNSKILENTYACVFFDGPHDDKSTVLETEFFLTRTPVGGVYIYDDLWMYSHDELIEPMLFNNGFEILEKKEIKASYRKIK